MYPPNHLSPKSATKIQCFLKCLYTLANWIRILKHLKAKCCRSNGIWWEKRCFKKEQTMHFFFAMIFNSSTALRPTNEKICHQNYNFFALRRKEVVKMKWKASSFFLDSSERKKAVRGAKSPLEIFFADNHIWLWSFIFFFRVSPMGLWSPFPLSSYFFLTAAKLVPRTSSTDVDYDYFQKLLLLLLLFSLAAATSFPIPF